VFFPKEIRSNIFEKGIKMNKDLVFCVRIIDVSVGSVTACYNIKYLMSFMSNVKEAEMREMGNVSL
jgi:hypothetical protein